MSPRHLALPSLLVIVLLSGATTLPAQVSGGTSGGTSGGSQSTARSSSSGSGSTTGSGGQSGSSFGGSATGSSTAGGGAASGAGGVTEPTFTEFGQAAQNLPSGFVGRSEVQTFVGSRGASQQTVDGGGQQQFSGAGQGGDGGGSGGGSTANARGSRMRVRQRIRFDSPELTTTFVQTRLQAQFTLLASRFPQVAAEMIEPGHVVLRGTVASDDEARLAAAVARVEAGVRKVTNELQVVRGEGVESGPYMPQ